MRGSFDAGSVFLTICVCLIILLGLYAAYWAGLFLIYSFGVTMANIGIGLTVANFFTIAGFLAAIMVVSAIYRFIFIKIRIDDLNGVVAMIVSVFFWGAFIIVGLYYNLPLWLNIMYPFVSVFPGYVGGLVLKKIAALAADDHPYVAFVLYAAAFFAVLYLSSLFLDTFEFENALETLKASGN